MSDHPEDLPPTYVQLPSLGECLARSAHLLRRAELNLGNTTADTMVTAAQGWVQLADTLVGMELNGVSLTRPDDPEGE